MAPDSETTGNTGAPETRTGPTPPMGDATPPRQARSGESAAQRKHFGLPIGIPLIVAAVVLYLVFAAQEGSAAGMGRVVSLAVGIAGLVLVFSGVQHLLNRRG